MPESIADSIKVGITCTGCQHRFEETMTRMKTNPELACPHCGKRFQIAFEDNSGVEKVDEALRNVRKSFDRFGKR
jgi:rRNA maturation endonuclease Nob1